MPANRDISLLIAELLLKHDEVVVSGIGTFFTEKKNLDFEEDIMGINPPSRALSFRDSFQSNDSLLNEAFCKEHEVSQEAAAQAIKSFATSVQRDLLLSKDCDLPGLGVLNFTEPNQIELGISYLDLDASFFGLSKLNYQPIVREKSTLAEEVFNKKESINKEEIVEIKKETEKAKSWSFENSILNKVAYVVVFLLSFGWFILANQGHDKRDKEVAFKPVPTRINVAPAKESLEDIKLQPQLSETTKHSNTRIEEHLPFENIMLYAFSDPQNIEKAKIRIEALGYEPILNQEQGLQTIQIKLEYQNQEDFDSKFNEIKSNITTRAYIITE